MSFIVFEGLDGSGKSTLAQGLRQVLEKHNISCVMTREPGGSALGGELRQLLLRLEGEPPTAKAELLLYLADRAQHVEKIIAPALEKGQWVLCDRFTASTVAFQSGGRQLNIDSIDQLNDYATGGLKPDLFVLLDLSVEDSAQRMRMRESIQGDSPDRFEQEAKDFHERVRMSYIQQAQKTPDRWFVLSATQSPEELLQELLSELKRRKWLVV
ncbi:MAG: dTMP kinase [Pseudobdellovibrionaceae bacterium]|nr:dTMP kinase [Bdellovibrionales bacterium]USN48861.1 MAG: dTMP kinase [Pseudobdellovibrionaceae bacterium]